MLIPYYFTDGNLEVGFKNNLGSHYINYANSKPTITPNYPDFGIKVQYVEKFLQKLSVVYARLRNQYQFKLQTKFSARSDKQDEGNQVLDDTEIFNNLINDHNLTESGLDNIHINSPLEHQIQPQEMKSSRWQFGKIISMITFFFIKLVKWW